MGKKAEVKVKADLIDRLGRVWLHVPEVDLYRNQGRWWTRERIDTEAGPVLEAKD